MPDKKGTLEKEGERKSSHNKNTKKKEFIMNAQNNEVVVVELKEAAAAFVAEQKEGFVKAIESGENVLETAAELLGDFLKEEEVSEEVQESYEFQEVQEIFFAFERELEELQSSVESITKETEEATLTVTFKPGAPENFLFSYGTDSYTSYTEYLQEHSTALEAVRAVAEDERWYRGSDLSEEELEECLEATLSGKEEVGMWVLTREELVELVYDQLEHQDEWLEDEEVFKDFDSEIFEKYIISAQLCTNQEDEEED